MKTAACQLEDVRCQKCNRLLCKRSANPLQAGEVIEIKCWKCDDLNYLMGGPKEPTVKQAP